MNTQLNTQTLLKKMWQDYLNLNPLAKTIHDLFESKGEVVLNDHIALRTFRGPETGLEVLAKPFLNDGYSEGDEYHFEGKKLYAKHYQHKNPDLPKIFISELKIEELSDFARETILDAVSQIPEGYTSQDNFLYSGRPWEATAEKYEKLVQESEYAGWMYAFGFRPNHFTVSINRLKNYKSVEAVNSFLKSQNIPLNTSGGEIKGGPEELLAQSSTLANKIEVHFSDKSLTIPSCYYEFALRYPTEAGDLYQGFVAKSADKIFESTDRQS